MAKAAVKVAAPEASREAERRRTILRAAVEVFARKGYHGCRIADVAREAGVAYGLVYHYFKNKEELLESVFQIGWSGFVDRVREAASTGGSLEEKVRKICFVAFEAYRHDPRGVRVLILEIARSAPVGQSGNRVNRQSAFGEVILMARDMFEVAKERGEIRSDLDSTLSAALLFGSIEMGLTAFVLGLMDSRNEQLLERARNQISESFLRGVIAQEKQPSSSPSNSGSEAGSWKSDKSSTRSRAPKRS